MLDQVLRQRSPLEPQQISWWLMTFDDETGRRSQPVAQTVADDRSLPELQPLNPDFLPRKSRKDNRKEETGNLPAGACGQASRHDDDTVRFDAPEPLTLVLRHTSYRMLTTEIAFALLISLAGITRIRAGPTIGSGNSDEDQVQVSLHTELSTAGTAAEIDDTNGSASALSRQTAVRACACQRLALCPAALPGLRVTETGSDWPWCYYFTSISKLFEESAMNFEPNEKQSQVTSTSERIGKRSTLRIRLRDTFQAIAERVFNDQELAWLIADINAGCIREDFVEGKRVVRLKENQEIVLPSKKQISVFYSCPVAHNRSTSLITIVEPESQNSAMLHCKLDAIVSPGPVSLS